MVLDLRRIAGLHMCVLHIHCDVCGPGTRACVCSLCFLGHYEFHWYKNIRAYIYRVELHMCVCVCMCVFYSLGFLFCGVLIVIVFQLGRLSLSLSTSLTRFWLSEWLIRPIGLTHAEDRELKICWIQLSLLYYYNYNLLLTTEVTRYYYFLISDLGYQIKRENHTNIVPWFVVVVIIIIIIIIRGEFILFPFFFVWCLYGIMFSFCLGSPCHNILSHSLSQYLLIGAGESRFSITIRSQ